jgi:CRP/FNR family cyclic AMP-dependent transcriptional regulator
VNTSCRVRPAESIGLRESKRHGIFSQLSDTTAKNLVGIEVATHYPQGAVIHIEGQPPLGIFVVHDGRIKLSATSSSGRAMILRFVGPGKVLGLPETIAGIPYETRATASESCHLSFIERKQFLNLLSRHGDLAEQVIRELSDSYLSMIKNLRESGMTYFTSRKLARFLLSWCEVYGNGEDLAVLSITHEEIGQMIGASRETVTRLLSLFKKKRLIRLNRSMLYISDGAALQNHVDGLKLKLVFSRQTRPRVATA